MCDMVRYLAVATQWHVRTYVSYWGPTGRDMLSLRLVDFDPKPTWAELKSRSAASP
jgi:hypothetical protein